MYGDLLKQAQPLGPPPAMKPGPMPVPAPMAGPSPAGPMGPPAPTPPSPFTVGPGGPIPTDQDQLAAYHAKQEAFLTALAHDYATKKISRDDLKKGAAYTGTQPYEEWRQENVAHLKEANK